MKTSLEKSHSKLSNFKLTMLCVIAALFVALFWVGLGLLNNQFIIGLSMLLMGILGTVLSLIIFKSFKR